MAQEINRVGTIKKTVEQNVVFNERRLINIYVQDGDSVFIEYVNVSTEGDAIKTITIPFDLFDQTESCLWNAIDELEGR